MAARLSKTTISARSRVGAVRRAAPLLAVVALCALTAACGPECDRRREDDNPAPFKGGRTDLAAGFYESAPAAGPYLEFPGGRKYRFFHGLGAIPRTFNAYLSFDEYPVEFAESAGNQVSYEPATAEYVDVRNDTCSNVMLRLTVSDPEPAAEAGDGG